MTEPTVKRIGLTETIALLRAELKREFPGTKFSIRRSRGTGYGTVYVDWTDGPKYHEVNAIAGHYAGATFDGMTDSTSYTSTVEADEVGAPVTVRYGTKFVLCSRNESDALRASNIRKVLRAFGHNLENAGALLAMDDSELVKATGNTRVDGDYVQTFAHRLEAEGYGMDSIRALDGSRATA